jgi:ABC-type transport system involved in cytochrome c biogenesis permease subunit
MGITHLCFGLSYLFALGAEITQQARPKWPLRLAGLVLAIAGLVAHTIYLVMWRPNPATGYGSLLLLAWVLAVFYLVNSVHRKPRPWGLFVLPLVVLLVGLSLLSGNADPAAGWFVGEHFWGIVHGLFVLFAAIGISVAFLASLMYLVQARRLRKKRPPLGGMRLLSLERLETMSRRATNLAFPMLTAGVLIGAIQIPLSQAAVSWTSPKTLSTIGLWVVALLLLYLRYGAHVPPRRLAWLTLLAFALLMVTLLAAHPFADREVTP